MAVITGRQNVERIYRWAHEKRWVLPCFNSENLTTTEAILSAVKAHGEHIGIPNLPIIIAITAKYKPRPQASFYTQTRRWDIGLRMFMEEVKILSGPGGPYEEIQVLIHLDHIIHGLDSELLAWDLSQFSSIIYDASKLALNENIKATAKFVREKGHLLLVEGACDEIIDAGGKETSELTDPDKAEGYYRSTGVDMIVANLGTEHRANISELHYRADYARKIKERVGGKMVLHGGSSVPVDSMGTLFDDGICKVNIWTLLERESSSVLFEQMVKNASKVAGLETAARLHYNGLLGEACISEGASINHFTTASRQKIVFEEMKRRISGYLRLWYK